MAQATKWSESGGELLMAYINGWRVVRVLQTGRKWVRVETCTGRTLRFKVGELLTKPVVRHGAAAVEDAGEVVIG
jgi:hypothetical protein